MNLGIGLGGLGGGWIATVAHPTSFTVLFLVDGATFLAYVGVLALVHDPGSGADEEADGRPSYRAVVRDRLFVRLWALNFLFVTAGYSLINLVPPFARDHARLSERQIGAVFFVNTALIVIVQLPISRAIEGRRRLRALALMPLLWVATWLLVGAGGYFFEGGAAFVVIGVALALFGVGECFHGPAHQALVAEIAPDHLRGRYFAVHSLSWGLAGTVGPAAGGFLLASAPFALWIVAAGLCLAATAGSLRTEPLVPERFRRIPRTEPAPPVIDIPTAG
jgi:MFS family permease